MSTPNPEVFVTSSAIDKIELEPHEIVLPAEGTHARVFEHQIDGPLFILRDSEGHIYIEIRKPRAAGKKKGQNIEILASVPISTEFLAHAIARASRAPFSKDSFKYFLDGLNGHISERPVEVVKPARAATDPIPEDKIVVDRYWFFKMLWAAVENRTEHYRQFAGISQLAKMLGLDDNQQALEEYQKGLAYVQERADARESKSAA